MKTETEQESESVVPGTEATLSAKDRLILLSRSVYGRGSRWVNDLIDKITRKQYASKSYRYLARELAERFVDHAATPRIVFSCADSLESSCDVLMMLAHFIQDETGGKVLLVDQTLRIGGVTDRLGYTGETGLTDCLNESGHSVRDCVRPTANTGVYILPAGRIFGKGIRPPDTQSVLSLLDKLNQFDYVLIQQGSIALDTRYLAFARLADLVLLYVEEGKTMVSEFEACRKIFRDYQVQEWGVIISESGV